MTRIALCVVLAVGSAAAPASADNTAAADAADQDEPSPLLREGELVGLLSVSTEGVSQEAKDGFISSVENSLNLAGFRVVPNTTLHEVLADSDYVDGCTFGPCLKAVYARTRVRLVVIARISGVGSAYSFVVSLLDTRTGRVRSQNAENCPVCTVDEALLQASNVVVSAVTGTGGAKVGDNPRQRGTVAPLEPGNKGAANRRTAGRVGLALLGLGVAAGAAGGYLLSTEERDDAAYAGLAGGAAFAVSGLTIILFSRSF